MTHVFVAWCSTNTLLGPLPPSFLVTTLTGDLIGQHNGGAGYLQWFVFLYSYS